MLRAWLGALCFGLLLVLAGCSSSGRTAGGENTGTRADALDSVPAVGPEFEMDDPVMGTGSWPVDYQPSIASDGAGTSLVVWTSSDNYGTAVWGARIRSDGTRLDPAGFIISPATTNPNVPIPVVASFAAGNFLVAWTNDSEVHARRVSSSGSVLDTSDIVIVNAGNTQAAPAVASDGTNWMVVWCDSRLGNGKRQLYGTRVSQDGVLLDPGGILISSSLLVLTPWIGYDGTNFLALWGGSTVTGARIASNGAVLDPAGISIATSGFTSGNPQPFGAFDGTNWLVVFNALQVSTVVVRGVRLSTAGVVVDSTPIPIASGGNSAIQSQVTHNGSNWLIVYGASDNTTHAVTMSSTGVVGTTALSIGNHPQAMVAYDGTYTVVVAVGDAVAVTARRMNAVGTVLDPSGFQVAPKANSQLKPAAASSTANTLVVWQDQRSPGAGIYAARTTASGVGLDGQGVAIATGTPQEIYTNPAVASDGTNWLVAWAYAASNVSQGQVIAALVGADGKVVMSNILIDSDAGSPAVAFDGTDWLVAYTYGGHSICGMRVNKSGQVLDTNRLVIATSTHTLFHIKVASNGTNWLVTWQEIVPSTDIHYPSQSDVRGQLVASDGTFVGTSIDIATSSADQTNPIVATDGTQWFAAWCESRSYGPYQLYGARLDPNGIVLDPSGSLLSTQSCDWDQIGSGGTAWTLALALSRYGDDWLVGWQSPAAVDTDIYGQLVTPQGTPTGSSFMLSGSPGVESTPVLTPTQNGDLLLAYLGAPHSSAMRIKGRMLCGSANDPNCNPSLGGGSGGQGGQPGAGGAGGAGAAGASGAAAAGTAGGVGLGGMGGVSGAAGSASASGGAGDGGSSGIGGTAASAGGANGASGSTATSGGADAAGGAGGTTSNGAGGTTSNGAGGADAAGGAGGTSGGVNGASGSGESAGHSGKSSNAGTASSSAGRAGAAGQAGDGGAGAPPSDAGCGCKVNQSESSLGGVWSIISLLVVMHGRRLRRRPARAARDADSASRRAA